MNEWKYLPAANYRASDGRWRLMFSLVVYATPWKAYSWLQVKSEYFDKQDPYKEYIHHLVQRFEGEVAIAWQMLEFSEEPLPRDADLWHTQFASNEQNYQALSRLTFQWSNHTRCWVIPDSVDLTKVGNTTILRSRAGENGHWHLNGGAITLAELFDKFGERYTVAELMLWYYNAPKILRTRQHAWGSKDVRAAAIQRWKTYGRPGHQD